MAANRSLLPNEDVPGEDEVDAGSSCWCCFWPTSEPKPSEPSSSGGETPAAPPLFSPPVFRIPASTNTVSNVAPLTARGEQHASAPLTARGTPLTARGQGRRLILDEVLQTERAYVRDLDILVTQFKLPLRMQLSAQQLEAVFSNCESLLPVRGRARCMGESPLVIRL